MVGKLFGIGVGPGDPDLVTLKAISTIGKCDVIAIPVTGNDESTALKIVEQYLNGKELLKCRFIMEHDMEKRRASRKAAGGDIAHCLEQGKDVGFITLGDPTIYSTYMYVHEIIIDMGYEAEIIPGITSFAAAASALGIALCEGNETLTICAGHGGGIGEILDTPGNKVIMKSGIGLTRVLDELKARGFEDSTKIACRVTMDGQRVFHSIEEYEKSPEEGYFTLAIVLGV